jgi:predicted nucleotidyltransferase
MHEVGLRRLPTLCWWGAESAQADLELSWPRLQSSLISPRPAWCWLPIRLTIRFALGGDLCSMRNMSAAKRRLPAAVLDEIIRQVVAVAQPDRIVLFGSAARGDMGPDGDVDLWVFESDVPHRRRLAQRIHQAFFGLAVPIDVIVVTPDDTAAFGGKVGTIIEPALREGREVHAGLCPPIEFAVACPRIPTMNRRAEISRPVNGAGKKRRRSVGCVRFQRAPALSPGTRARVRKRPGALWRAKHLCRLIAFSAACWASKHRSSHKTSGRSRSYWYSFVTGAR